MLNEIPVLDNGYIALLSVSLKRDQFVELKNDFFKGQHDKRLLDVPVIHFKIKCPLFVQLTFPEHGLKYVVSRAGGKLEAYKPNVSEIQAPDLESNEAIAGDIAQTTDALLINPKAYQMEGCNHFISQVISPISVYNVLVVSGTLSQWLAYIDQGNFPAPIKAYRDVIQEVLLAEYDFLKDKSDP